MTRTHRGAEGRITLSVTNAPLEGGFAGEACLTRAFQVEKANQLT
jgi:hypothetical protein